MGRNQPRKAHPRRPEGNNSRSLRVLLSGQAPTGGAFTQALSFPRHDLSGFCELDVPLPNRGRRESQAPTAPAAPCAGSALGNAHGFDRYSRDIPAFPAQWFTAYTCSPRGAAFLAPVADGTYRRRSARVAAPEPHDFAVRCKRFARQPKPPDAAASIATRATLRDERVSSLLTARAEGEHTTDLRNCQEEFRKKRVAVRRTGSEGAAG